MPFGKSAASYETRLLREVYNEALRFALAYAYREDGLTEIEKDYAREKIRHCIDLYDTRQYYPLLLNLISLVEDAETLTIRDQSDFMRKILYFRDHLQDLLVSDAFLQYQQGLIPHTAIYQIIEAALKADLDIALENFLLPGNMEDGLDKSRHWNVFGGIAIYKSPEEALVLALKRENMDLRENNFAPEAMQEFIRDTIANINGIYYVLSINPDLIPDLEGL